MSRPRLIAIERSVPVPDRTHTRGLYPWRQMKPGDSFAVGHISPHRLGNAARSFAAYHGNGWKFTTRTEGHGARVWRIK